MKKVIDICGRKIGHGYPPYIIAEISGNHNGCLDKAIALLELAKKCGVDAVKIQTYRPDTMTIQCDKSDFLVDGGLWHGKTLYELYEWAHTPWEWHEALFKKAREIGITLFSSPFDETAVEFLEDFDVPAYKIASFEMTDLPLIEKVARTGKPLIISTGMANFDEIAETVDLVRSTGNQNLVLLHCVSSYPARHTETNLNTIPDLEKRFDTLVGLSDHTLTNVTSIASISLGASVIEKHFIDSRDQGGPDAAFSVEPAEFESLCRDVAIAWECLGEVSYRLSEGEKSSQAFRRSVYVVQDIKKGDVFTTENVRRIRPGYGIAPKYLSHIIGQVAPVDIEKGTAFSIELFSIIR